MNIKQNGSQFFSHIKIQDKFFLCFIMIIFISVASIGILSYLKSSDILKAKTSKYTLETVQQISTSIDYVLQRVDELSRSLAFDRNVQAILNKDPATLNERAKMSYIKLVESIIVTNYDNSLIQSITIVGNNGMKFAVPGLHGNQADFQSYFQEAKTYEGKNVWINEVGTKRLLVAAREIIDLTTVSSLGFITINLRYGVIAKLLNNVNFDKSGYIIIIDRKGNLITPVNNAFGRVSDIKKLIRASSGNLIFNLSGKKYLISYHTSKYTGWKIIGVISISKLYHDSHSIGSWLFFTTLGILVFAFILARIMAGTITNPIKKMIIPMKLVSKGDFSVMLPVAGNDEIGELSKGFNSMIAKIRSLIDVVYKEQLLQKESEFKALQAQINPHFLYNTLETINWMAKSNDMDEICNMVAALGHLMRISISNKKRYITINEELMYINDYLYIQKIRYRDKITTEIMVEENLKAILIPKLIIQPLVENALVHGIERKKGKGFIKIVGRKVADKIIFEIEDDGVGMSKEQTDAILMSDDARMAEGHSGIGVSNVHKRIQLLYGEEYGLKVFSVFGVGTKVQVYLPADNRVLIRNWDRNHQDEEKSL
jgi:two-component system sensor histidine kinase YesM